MRLSIPQITKKFGGRRLKKAHKYAATVYVFSDEDFARLAFSKIIMDHPHKEVNQFGSELHVQPW